MIGLQEWSLLTSGSGQVQEGCGLVEQGFLAMELEGERYGRAKPIRA